VSALESLRAASFGGRPFTIVGARGFIGSAVALTLEQVGAHVTRLRHDEPVPPTAGGTIVYCTGIPSGADRNPARAKIQHVDIPQALLENVACERFIYLSSTRVYEGIASTSETEDIDLLPPHGDAYIRTKRAGERVVLDDPRGRVLRLANVFGNAFTAAVFLSDILRQAATSGNVAVRSALKSEKDYVSLAEVAAYIPLLGVKGTERIYNIGRGKNTTHGEIFAVLERLGIDVTVPEGAPEQIFAPIRIDRLRREFPAPEIDVLEKIPELLTAFRTAHTGTVGA